MPTKTKGFKLTEDDIKILAYIYQFRAVTISHLMILTGRKQQSLNRSLVKLVGDYYLFCNERSFQKYVYTLNNKAVPELVKAGIGSKEKIKWQVRNRKQSEYFIDHTLMGTDIHLALELASRVSDIEVADCRHEGKSLKDKVTTFLDGEQQVLPVEPDKFITLLDTRRPSERNHFPIFLENETRKNTDTKPFLRKIRGYNAFFLQKLHTEKYGFETIPVITVTLKDSDVTKLCDKTREILPKNSRRFYYFTSISRFPLDNPVHVHEDILISPKDLGEGKTFEERKHYSLVPPLVSQSTNR